ncbi:hypothetical protein [Stenotrophomonas sp.]|uniref:hypothetical protein n=1 Tax=Stenotrophomonas sp. TaxID=69392 RepID=UPI00374D7B51
MTRFRGPPASDWTLAVASAGAIEELSSFAVSAEQATANEATRATTHKMKR